MWRKQLSQQDLNSGARCELLQVLAGDLPRDSISCTRDRKFAIFWNASRNISTLFLQMTLPVLFSLWRTEGVGCVEEIAEWVGLCPKKGPFYTGHWGPKQSRNKTRAGWLLFLDTREGFCVFESCCVWVSRHSAESTVREEAPGRARGHEQLDWAAVFIFARRCLSHCWLRGLPHIYWVPSIKQGAFLSRLGIIFLLLRWLLD